MKQGYRLGFSTAEKTELWDRWQRGESLKSDWPGIWQALIVYIFPTGAARRHPSPATAAIPAGIDTIGTRGDITRHRGSVLDPLNGQVAGPLALDGKP